LEKHIDILLLFHQKLLDQLINKYFNNSYVLVTSILLQENAISLETLEEIVSKAENKFI
jgi:hypothetical protein